jgi:hypothetical protein
MHVQRSALTALLLFIAGCSSAPDSPSTQAPATAEPVTVILQFDGGHAFIRDPETGVMTVASFNAGGVAHHPFKLMLTEGTYVDGALRPDSTNGVRQVWSLSQAKYGIRFPQGPASGGVTLPDPGAVSTTNPCPSIANDSNAANFAYLLPNITDLAGQNNAVIDASKFEDRVTIPAGTMTLRRAYSCYEFQRGTEVRTRQPLTAGLSGVQISFPISEPTLKVELTGGAKPETIEFRPVDVPLKGGGSQKQIVLSFAHLVVCGDACVVKQGEVIPDFSRYYDLLDTPTDPEARWLPRKVAAHNNATPGDDCVPGYYRAKLR